MLVIRVEIWPLGRKEVRRHIGTAVITNDGTGSFEFGNYNTYVGDELEEDPFAILNDRENTIVNELRTEGYPRLHGGRLGFWHLVGRIFGKLE